MRFFFFKWRDRVITCEKLELVNQWYFLQICVKIGKVLCILGKIKFIRLVSDR